MGPGVKNQPNEACFNPQDNNEYKSPVYEWKLIHRAFGIISNYIPCYTKTSGRIHICAKKQDVASDCAQRENMPGHIFVLPMYVREAAGGRSCVSLHE